MGLLPFGLKFSYISVAFSTCTALWKETFELDNSNKEYGKWYPTFNAFRHSNHGAFLVKTGIIRYDAITSITKY